MLKDNLLIAERIIQDAGGELVGRTRFQKIAFLLKLAGFENSFSFEYRHYGPFSEDLAHAIDVAAALGFIIEEERTAEWGGRYCIYKLDKSSLDKSFVQDPERENFVRKAKQIDAVELELAATAAYLFEFEGIGKTIEGNPWDETRRRKPSKASSGRLEHAIEAYKSLCEFKTHTRLPELPQFCNG
jgi:uncharacterized protein